jgi:hypothetical protein
MPEIRRGTLRSFDAGGYRATLTLAGSLATDLAGVAVARNLDAAEMLAGRSVAIIFFDAANPDDAVVIAVWA